MNRLWILVIAGIALMWWDSSAVSRSPVNPSGLEVGRFQIADGYILDTVTGFVDTVESWQRVFPQGRYRTPPGPVPLPTPQTKGAE